MADTVDIGFKLAELKTDEAVDHLKEVGSGMKRSELLRVEVPDFDRAVTSYKAGEEGAELLVLQNGRFKSIWNQTKVRRALDFAGFMMTNLERSPTGTLIATAMKYELAEPELPMRNIRAIMSLPRIAWTTTMSVLHEACMHLGIETSRSTGVFWGQCLERMIEQGIKDKMEYILTVDYDSVFDHHDIVRLWQIMEANKDIAALVPMQIQRDRVNNLCSIRDGKGGFLDTVSNDIFATDVVDIYTGHFGLTLIRLSALEGIPRPLFHSTPDSDGSWGEGKVDEDIKFWMRLDQAGKRVCLCPRVRIGHLQLVVTWPDDNFQAHHQYHPEFIDAGRPPFSLPR